MLAGYTYQQYQTEGLPMEIEFRVQNVKCDGCANAIQSGLSQDPRVKAVTVDVPAGRVTVTTDADIRAELHAALKKLGYPERVA